MYVCSGNKNVWFNEKLPRWDNGRYKGDINMMSMVGMSLSGSYYGVKFSGLKILEYIKGRSKRFIVEYNGVKSYIYCGNLLNQGNLRNILDCFIDLNNKYIDNNNVVHIFITNTNGNKFEALYSGYSIEGVMNSNWCVVLNKNRKVISVLTNSYNKSGEKIKLHQVDLGSFVDHINNNTLDNRKENLRKSNPQDNGKNKNRDNGFGVTGINKYDKGWVYCASVNGYNICTKLKYDLSEVEIDALISQRYLGYNHNEDRFCELDYLSKERIKEVTDLIDSKIANNKNKIRKTKEYNHNIIDYGDYKKLIKDNGEEMIFDCDEEFIKNMNVCENNGYWLCAFVENGVKIQNRFHKELLRLRSNRYNEYYINVDHLDNNTNNNTYGNLAITTSYSNQCNKKSQGYRKLKSGNYIVTCMRNYKFWDLIGGVKRPLFPTEQEAIDEVIRRKEIIEKSRVKLKTKEELEELIQYCFENNYTQENGLADLDLGYLYWKGILLMKKIS